MAGRRERGSWREALHEYKRFFAPYRVDEDHEVGIGDVGRHRHVETDSGDDADALR